jgi:hypothetical protein
MNKTEIIDSINSFKKSNIKNRYLMVVTNNNIKHRQIQLAPIKVRSNYAILTIIVYTIEHLQFCNDLDLQGITGMLLDNETKNNINIYQSLKNTKNIERVLPISPSELVKVACEEFINSQISNFRENQVLIYGTGNLAKRIAISLLNRGIHTDFISRKSEDVLRKELEGYSKKFEGNNWTRVTNDSQLKKYDMIFACYPGIQINELNDPNEFMKTAINVDVGGSAYSATTIYKMRELNNPIIYISIEKTLFDWLEGASTSNFIKPTLQSIQLNCGHVYVVIGQAMLPSEIGVDSLPYPSRIYGQLGLNGVFNEFECICKQKF